MKKLLSLLCLFGFAFGTVTFVGCDKAEDPAPAGSDTDTDGDGDEAPDTDGDGDEDGGDDTDGDGEN